MALTPGTRIGPYEVTAQIGVGGMGEVYRATDINLKRDVALKVLPDALATGPERLARFQREAEVLAALNHPNIAHIYGLERSDGTTALVIELVEGPTLADRIAQGPILVDEALPIAKQIAEALEAAHEQGIIHRDLKPANIKVKPDGTVKVLDFGLAKAMEPAGAMSPNASMSPTITTPAMTQAGMILGTAAYMSPEQAKGRPVDRRSDIWAFGAVLFEMLTGQRAFGGEGVSETLADVMRVEPAWNLLPANLSPTLLAYLKRCLAKDWRQRLGDIHDMRLALDGAFDIVARTGAAALPHTRRRLWLSVSGGLVLAAMTGVAAFYATQLRSPDRTASIPRITFEIPKPLGGAPLQFALSPDGTHIVMAARSAGDNAPRLWLRPLDQLNGRFLEGTQRPATPFWSPDGRFVAYFADGKLKKVDLLGAPPQTICDALPGGTGIGRQGNGGTWNHDNVIVFSQAGNGPLFRVSAAGGVPTQLTQLDASREEVSHGHPYFLPDGQHFLYLAISTKTENSGIWMGSLNSTDRTFLVNSTQKATFAPPDWLLFMRQDTLLAQRLHPRRLTILGDPVPIAENVTVNTGNAAAGFTTSENGMLAYLPASSATQQDRAVWVTADGRVTKDAINSPVLEAARYPSLSPDGRRVALTLGSANQGQIWVYDLTTGTPPTKLTFQGHNINATWTPDGTQILFSSTNAAGGGQPPQLKLVPADGSQVQPRVLSGNGGDGSVSTVRADGTVLLPRAVAGGSEDLWTLHLTGDPAAKAWLHEPPFRDDWPAFSPDGRWAAYVSNRTGRNELFVRAFPEGGAPVRVSSEGIGSVPVWSRDGKTLFFIGLGSPPKMMSAAVASTVPDIRFATPVPLFDATPFATFGFGVAPDGRFFLLQNADATSGTTAPTLTVVLNWFEELQHAAPMTPAGQ